ncbi:Zinc finger CCCH domain-containing protein 30 [Apostasia shenzhenica]|uniref:Zinc finger CCCH domain-containing protein 30 n=1 Tax=Apostasia shenzhenica TaxID=1088818 RepID=A0A2I0B4T1_9ASPA|nr:Zinc finger CCCH domain-containing protein 30 [Apostasia shenzhenica]
MGFPAGDDSVAELLEFAAEDDDVSFRLAVDRDPAALHAAGRWYGRCRRSGRMKLLFRTPLMIAATYGSLEVLRFILSLSSGADVDRRCGVDGVTALHCAASGCATTAALVVSLLIEAGADANTVDAFGLRPFDVISITPTLSSVRSSLEGLLGKCSPPLSPSSDSTSSSSSSAAEEKKEKKTYPIDPSIPDINSSIYASDDFRMFAFKIQPCSRAYSHDWTECPFVHPGENARRRDPRRFQYGCTPCPEFRRGQCPRGDLCEYAHGVFECWLHPTLYRTRLCKDGGNCGRRVCFFAHSSNELRSPHVQVSNTKLSRLRIPCSKELDINLLSPSGVHNGRLGLLNLDDKSVNCSSPRFQCEYWSASLSPSGNLQHHQSLLLPSNGCNVLSPRSLNVINSVNSTLGMAPRSNGTVAVSSPLSSYSDFDQEKQQRSLLLSNLNRNLPRSPNCEEVARSIGAGELDLSWVQSLVGKAEVAPNSAIDEEHAILGAWLEEVHQKPAQ